MRQKNDEKPEFQSIQCIPDNVIVQMRMLFPDAKSKSDIVSAMTYILSDGGCEISPSAMQLVKHYRKYEAVKSDSAGVASEIIAVLNDISDSVRSIDAYIAKHNM